MRNGVVFLVLLMLVFAFSTTASAEKKKKKKVKKAIFTVRVVYAKKGDKDKMPKDLDDVKVALKQATLFNVFELLSTSTCVAKFGKDNYSVLGVKDLNLNVHPTEIKDERIKGTVSVISARGTRFTILGRVNIGIKIGGVLCIVPPEDYKDGEIIVVLKLTKVKE